MFVAEFVRILFVAEFAFAVVAEFVRILFSHSFGSLTTSATEEQAHFHLGKSLTLLPDRLTNTAGAKEESGDNSPPSN